jgi:hypothetical protein
MRAQGSAPQQTACDAIHDLRVFERGEQAGPRWRACSHPRAQPPGQTRPWRIAVTSTAASRPDA